MFRIVRKSYDRFFHQKHRKKRDAFTLVELLLVIALIAILSSLLYGRLGGFLFKAREARALAELNQIASATKQMVIDQGGDWPADVSRGVPPGIEEYLGPGNWPDAPFNDTAEYDWDNFTGSDGKQVYQISIRFCPLGQPGQCDFPKDAVWAENFDYHSSYYLCLQGKCKAHPGKPDDHPGYCVNC